MNHVLSPVTLDMQASLFVVTMATNAKACMQKPNNINQVTCCWRTIDNNAMLRHGLFEYLKVVEIAIAMVLGSVQDERTFNTIYFMKSRLRKSLTTHLELVVGMEAQSLYTLFNCSRHGRMRNVFVTMLRLAMYCWYFIPQL